MKDYTKKELLGFLKMKLATDERWATRALERIYDNQREDEQINAETRHVNGVGFTGHDAPILTSIFQSYLAHGRRMTPKMAALVMRKMQKYAGQLFRASYFDMDKMKQAYAKQNAVS